MARKSLISFVDQDDLNHFHTETITAPTGRIEDLSGDQTQSVWPGQRQGVILSRCLLGLFEKNLHWRRAHPVLLGSWALTDLCPGSDLDVVFLGPEESVRHIQDWANQLGLPLRGRVPHNISRLTEGIDWKDEVSLLRAKPLTDFGRQVLREQTDLWAKPKNLRRLCHQIV